MQNTKEDLWSTNFSINGSMPIFTGLQNKNIIIQNQLTYESSKYDIESVKSDVTISIVNAYLQVLFTNELLKNAQNQIELSIALLNKMKQYSGVGYKNEIDLLQLKADLAIKKVSLVNAKGQLETKKIDLQE
jgi:outer membrane protein